MKIVDADGTNITSELLEKWDVEYKQSWRWKLIDRFFYHGFDGYNISYLLIHPWKFVNSCCRQCKYAWQRVFRGWDDRVVWSIDNYLAKSIPQWIRALKENQIGYPMSMHKEEDFIDAGYSLETTEDSDKEAIKKWDNILNQIAEGFEAYTKIDDESLYPGKEGYEELLEKYEIGFKLLKEHFSDLWD
jgi:hypothetical protein